MRFSISALLAAALLATDADAHHRQGGWRYGRPGQVQNTNNKIVYKTVTVVAGGAPAAPTTLAKQTKTKQPAAVEVTTTKAPAPEAPAADSPSASNLDADQKAGLDAHNAARSEVGQPALTWDEGLAKDAQEWANHLASIGSLTHSQGSGQGENLYMQSGNGGTPFASASEMWIAEKADYNGQPVGEGNFGSYGHYTQIVWSSTTKVGMAVASGNSGTYVVARYTPAGNYVGKTPF